MVKRVLVVYGVDVDAVSGWYVFRKISNFGKEGVFTRLSRINTCSGESAGPTDVSRGVFGATVGIDRILKLFDKYAIKGTWFVPGHSVESFTTQLKKVRDNGHEMYVNILIPCVVRRTNSSNPQADCMVIPMSLLRL